MHRRRVPLALFACFWAAAADAQRPTVVFVPTVTNGWGHEIYRDLLVPTVDSRTYDGWLVLSGATRLGLQIEVSSPLHPWGAFVSYAAGKAELSSGGDRADAGFRRRSDTQTAVLSLGVRRRLPTPFGLPKLQPPRMRVGLAGVALRIEGEKDEPSFDLYKIPRVRVRDFLSPGVELSLGLSQPLRGRLDLRFRAAYAVLRHDTEGMDAGYRWPGESGTERLATWGRAGELGLGLGFRL